MIWITVRLCRLSFWNVIFQNKKIIFPILCWKTQVSIRMSRFLLYITSRKIWFEKSNSVNYIHQHFLLFQCIRYVFFVSCWVQKEWVSFLQWFTMGQESQNLLSSMNRVHRKKIVGQRLRKENRCKFQKIKKSCLPEQSRVNWLKLTLPCTYLYTFNSALPHSLDKS